MRTPANPSHTRVSSLTIVTSALSQRGQRITMPAPRKTRVAPIASPAPQVPHVAIADVGQAIIVKNKDRFLHTSAARDAKGKQVFNVALPFKDAEKQQSFDKRGFYTVVCDVHTWMNGWVAVLEGEPAAITNVKGEFSLTNVPSGKQTLHFWHETLGEKTVAVEVKDGAAPVELKFPAKK